MSQNIMLVYLILKSPSSSPFYDIHPWWCYKFIFLDIILRSSISSNLIHHQFITFRRTLSVFLWTILNYSRTKETHNWKLIKMKTFIHEITYVLCIISFCLLFLTTPIDSDYYFFSFYLCWHFSFFETQII